MRVKPEGTYGDVKCPSRRPPTTGFFLAGGKDTATILRFLNNGTYGGGRGPVLSGPPLGIGIHILHISLSEMC